MAKKKKKPDNKALTEGTPYGYAAMRQKPGTRMVPIQIDGCWMAIPSNMVIVTIVFWPIPISGAQKTHLDLYFSKWWLAFRTPLWDPQFASRLSISFLQALRWECSSNKNAPHIIPMFHVQQNLPWEAPGCSVSSGIDGYHWLNQGILDSFFWVASYLHVHGES